MDKKELAYWMGKHRFAEAMRVFSINHLMNHQGYEPFEDLATKGEATVVMSLSDYGNLVVRKAETFEGELEKSRQEIRNVEVELKEARKAIKARDKEITSLKKEAKAAKKTPKKVEKMAAMPSAADWPE